MNDKLILIFQTVLFLAIKVINRCFFVVAGSPKYFILTVSEVMLLFYQRILTRLDFTSSDQTSDKERPVVWKKTLQSKIITSVTNGIQTNMYHKIYRQISFESVCLNINPGRSSYICDDKDSHVDISFNFTDKTPTFLAHFYFEDSKRNLNSSVLLTVGAAQWKQTVTWLIHGGQKERENLCQ